jgi:hypothetical protein
MVAVMALTEGGGPSSWRLGEAIARIAAIALRVVSIYFGFDILQHEVYEAESIEPLAIVLGLWLIGVPPALWLDTLRRSGDFLQGRGVKPPDPGEDRSDADRR